MKYRKKPVVVDAEQFFVGKPLPFNERGPVVCFDGEWYVETIHGQRANIVDGDWIILEQGGKLYQAYPCKPEVFDRTYEVVSS